MKAYQFISLALITLLVFSSCGKYEEGPDFSLRTKKKRLTSHWKLHKLYINNYVEKDIDIDLLLYNNGTFHFGHPIPPMFLAPSEYDFHADSSGQWALTKNKEFLRLWHFEEGSNDVYKMVDWRILRLETTHMNLSREENENTIRLEFIRQGKSNNFQRIRRN